MLTISSLHKSITILTYSVNAENITLTKQTKKNQMVWPPNSQGEVIFLDLLDIDAYPAMAGGQCQKYLAEGI